MDFLIQFWEGTGIYSITWKQVIMLFIGFLLLYLAIVKKFEPLLLVTIGFGGILANIPGAEMSEVGGLLHQIYSVGIETSVFPLVIFM